MARIKILESVAYELLTGSSITFPRYLAASYSTTLDQITAVFGHDLLVIKLDQGVKKRGNQGFVLLNLTAQEVISKIATWNDLGWSQYLITESIIHKSDEEHFLSLTRCRNNWSTLYSTHGGIQVESFWDQASEKIPFEISKIVSDLIPVLDKYHLTMLEINPLIIRNGEYLALDCACEIDSTALGLPELSQFNLAFPREKSVSLIEQAVATLDATTPASLKFKLLNRNGSIWMLLSGGGASLVLADDVVDQGMGELLGNYGEYSGSPSPEDTFLYTQLILNALLASKASKKVLIIAGGVANFTDVYKTFLGIIRALSAVSSKLRAQKVLVYVRRGGPHEATALVMMHDFLKECGILGSIHGHESPLTTVITEAKVYLT